MHGKRPALRRLVQGWLMYVQQVTVFARDYVGLLTERFRTDSEGRPLAREEHEHSGILALPQAPSGCDRLGCVALTADTLACLHQELCLNSFMLAQFTATCGGLPAKSAPDTPVWSTGSQPRVLDVTPRNIDHSLAAKPSVTTGFGSMWSAPGEGQDVRKQPPASFTLQLGERKSQGAVITVANATGNVMTNRVA